MRKRTLYSFFDSLFWFLVYTAPLWVYCFQLACLKQYYFDLYTFADVLFDMLGFDLGNPILSVFIELFTFGADDPVLPLFNAQGLILPYLAYFISCVCLHVIVDIILFIPRWAHHIIAKYDKE